MKNVFYIILAIFVLMQFIPAEIKSKPTDPKLEIKVSNELTRVFKRSCYDCHSNSVNLPWYTSIAPMKFSIQNHVELGRKWLNFSEWENYTKKEKDDKLKGIFRTVYAAMPLESYIWFHPEAKLTKEEIKMIRDWTGKAPY